MHRCRPHKGIGTGLVDRALEKSLGGLATDRANDSRKSAKED